MLELRGLLELVVVVDGLEVVVLVGGTEFLVLKGRKIQLVVGSDLLGVLVILTGKTWLRWWLTGDVEGVIEAEWMDEGLKVEGTKV